MTADPAALLALAERTIQQILIRLANDHGIEVESVEVDTRRFANLAVSIVPVERRKASAS